MTTRGMTVALLVLLTAPLQAQNPARGQRPRQPRAQMPMQPQGDSGQPMMQPGMGPDGPGGPGMGGPQREMLRQRVQERFGQMVQAELQLSEPQMTQLRTAMRTNEDRRRDIMRREQDIQRAIHGQMQVGVAANADSLNRLLNASGQTRVDMAQSEQAFQRDLSFLTPVQRARLMMMVQRMEQRMKEIVQRRPAMQGRMQRPN